MIQGYPEILYIGDDFFMPVKFQRRINDDVYVTDITGYTVHFLLQTGLEQSVTPSIENIVIAHSDPLQGETTGQFTNAETSLLTEGKYYLVIKWIDTLTLVQTKAIFEINVMNSGKLI